MTNSKTFIAAVRKRLEAATPGPWAHEVHAIDFHPTGVIWQQAPSVEPGMFSSPNIKIIARADNDHRGWNKKTENEFVGNSELIASAPTDLKALTDALEIALGQIDKFTTDEFYEKNVKIVDGKKQGEMRSIVEIQNLAREAQQKINDLFQGVTK